MYASPLYFKLTWQQITTPPRFVAATIYHYHFVEYTLEARLVPPLGWTIGWGRGIWGYVFF